MLPTNLQQIFQLDLFCQFSVSEVSDSCTACTQEEVNKVIEVVKVAQKSWAMTPLWKRAELLHKAATNLKDHKHPIVECLVEML